MWARVVEVMLGCWLALSPFIFRHAAEQQALWVNDLLCAVIVITFALCSFWYPLRHAHLGIVGVGLWLIVAGYLASLPPPPASQNHVIVGLFLLMFAIIPNDASRPPQPWQEFCNASQKSTR